MHIKYRQNFGASGPQYRDMYSACLLRNKCTLLKHFVHSLFMCFLKVPEYMFINISVSLHYSCRHFLELISAFSELVPQAGQKREWCHWGFNRLQALESQVESLAHLKASLMLIHEGRASTLIWRSEYVFVEKYGFMCCWCVFVLLCILIKRQSLSLTTLFFSSQTAVFILCALCVLCLQYGKSLITSMVNKEMLYNCWLCLFLYTGSELLPGHESDCCHTVNVHEWRRCFLGFVPALNQSETSHAWWVLFCSALG